MKKNKKWAPVLCNVLGTVILISIILLLLPTTLPRIAGGDVFEVVSGSMEPEIPVGSVVFVKAAPAESIAEGDIIAFYSETTVVTHRVVMNQTVEGKFITKGDANEKEDLNPVNYNQLIGKVWLHLPVLGSLLTHITSRLGKIYLFVFALCGVLFYVLGAEMKKKM